MAFPSLLYYYASSTKFFSGKRKNVLSFLFYISLPESWCLIYLLTLYFIYNLTKYFTYPVIYEFRSIFLYTVVMLYLWTPLIILLAGSLKGKLKSLKNRLLPWNITNILAGAVIILLMAFVVYKRAYNKMADMMLGFDHYAQHGEWGKLLKLSDRYPGYNTLVIYYTNLALYKSGKLMDMMFNYPQIGSQGLRLKWQRNLNLFFGGEVFSQLGYNNESIHWAFESLVAKGHESEFPEKIGCRLYCKRKL